MSILRYFTATRDAFFEFWMRFFNPQNLSEIKYKDIFEIIELLARGSFNMDATLVSEQFAYRFLDMIKRKDCIFQANNKELWIDMKKFRFKLKKNEIDIEYLNQLLKSDSQYIVEGDDELDVFTN